MLKCVRNEQTELHSYAVVQNGYSRPDSISQSVIFFVNRKYRGIRNLGVFFYCDSVKVNINYQFKIKAQDSDQRNERHEMLYQNTPNT